MRRLFLAELHRSWTSLWRYPLQAVTGMLMTLLLFLALLAGVQYVAGGALRYGDRLDNIVVGYVLWNTLVFAMGNIAMGLQGEAQIGTLEQLFLSPLSGATIFLIRALASQTVSLIINLAILGFLLVVTGVSLHFAPAILLPVITSLGACYGIGLILGSLALAYKRIESVMQLSQFGLMAFVIVPFESWHTRASIAFYALPLTPSAALLRSLMARGDALDLSLLLIGVLNGTAYLLLGILMFQWAEAQTKDRGLLGAH